MPCEPLNMIQKVESKTLKIFAMLEKYPIYEYISGENANILCAGSFDVLYPYIAGIATIGQMLDVKLRLHIVTADFDFKNRLLEKAPLLEYYSNLSKEQDNHEIYAEFFFYKKVSDVKEICRYTIAAFKGAEPQRNAVREIAAAAASITENVCIHYTGAKQNEDGIPSNVTFNRLDRLNLRANFLISLGEQAFRLHYLYMREGNPKCNYAKCREDFAEDAYDQTSSTVAALHCKYKLFSIGINPRNKKESVIRAYDEKVFGEDKTVWNSLIYLEHRRWMMHTIFLGYRMATMDEINRYAFVDGNYCWRSDKLKLHNCLVPSSRDSGMMLSQIPKNKWANKLKDIPFDQLDRMSLEVHQLAGKKMEIARRAVEGELSTIRNLLIQGGIFLEKDKEIFEAFRDCINELFNGMNLTLAEACFADIEQCMKEYALPRVNLNNIRIHLKIVFEYYSFHDFKASDRVMIDDLLYMLYAPFNIALIKPISEKVIDNIVSPLMLEPETVVYVTQQAQAIDDYEKFFKGRGRGTEVESAVIGDGDIAAVKRAFKKVVNRYADRPCVVDITGASALLAGAAMQLAQENPHIGVICADAAKQQIINIYNFTEAVVYRQRQAISTQEAYGLFGARQKDAISGDAATVLKLQQVIPKVWQFYRQVGRKDYEVLCRFLTHYLGRSGIVSWPLFEENPPAEREESFERDVAAEYFNDTGLKNVLIGLQDKRVIRELLTRESNVGTVKVSFKLPRSFVTNMNRLFNELGKERYEIFTFQTWSEKRAVLHVGVRNRNGGMFRAIVSDTFYCNDKDYSIKNDVMPWLRNMRECGVLANNPSQNGRELNFRFNGISNESAKSIFAKSGSILELYVWWAAVTGKICDEVYPNFGFEWDENGLISNELDLILGQGLETAAVSCKTGAYKREDVYEVLYLAKKFSLNSRAAIIYLGDRGTKENNAVEISTVERIRIREMGVELIVIYDLENEAKETLGADAQPQLINQLTVELLAKALQHLFE